MSRASFTVHFLVCLSCFCFVCLFCLVALLDGEVTCWHRCPFWLVCLKKKGPWFRWFIAFTRTIYLSKRPPMLVGASISRALNKFLAIRASLGSCLAGCCELPRTLGEPKPRPRFSSPKTEPTGHEPFMFLPFGPGGVFFRGLLCKDMYGKIAFFSNI